MSHLHDATVEFNHAETNKTRRDEIDASWPCTPKLGLEPRIGGHQFLG